VRVHSGSRGGAGLRLCSLDAQKCHPAFTPVAPCQVTSHAGDDVDADLLLVERRILANAGVSSKQVRLWTCSPVFLQPHCICIH